MNDSALNDDEHLTRDVYTHFGVAVYLAQMLEKAVLNAVVLTETLAAAGWTAEGFRAGWDARFAKVEKLPLGPLLKRFDRSVRPRPALLTALDEALATRNHLAHYYFWEHAEDALSVPGREAMVAELLVVHQQFEDLLHEVTRLTFGVVDTVGGSSGQLAEKITELEAAMRADVRARDKEQGTRGFGGDRPSSP